VKVHLAADTSTSLALASSPLKFDPGVEGGVGNQLKTLHPLGTATFKKGDRGQADTIKLSPEATTEALVLKAVNAGEPVRLVVTPADDNVAATYSGADPGAAENRPALKVVVE
jgi:hypothetical protein